MGRVRHVIAAAVAASLVASLMVVLVWHPVAAFAGGGPPSMPESLSIPNTPIVASSGHVGYLPGSSQVTPSGAFAYSIPLDVPAGRAGMQPTLSLDYASGVGSGFAGIGWSVSGATSTITRCTRSLSSDGQVAAIRFDASDVFCWNGQKLKPDGVAAAGVQHYVTESESFAGIASRPGRAEPLRPLGSADGAAVEHGIRAGRQRSGAEHRARQVRRCPRRGRER